MESFLKQLFLIGLGTTSLLAERARELADEWVKEGKIDPQQAAEFVREATERVKSEQENLEAFVQRQVRNVLQDLGVPRQNEMDELRGRIDRLERQVRELENRLWR